MFQSVSRSASRRLLVSHVPLKPLGTRRFLSTIPLAQRSRSWKSSAMRWALAIGGVYYYNTSSVFAEQPDEAISLLDEKLHQIQEAKLPTLESIVEEKRKRFAEEQAHEAQTKAEPIPGMDEDSEEPGSVQDLEDEADQQGAFNPETGEINWDCPCLGGMAHGPCGEEFKEAFSCFVYSKEEPKGMECIDKFKGMQDCFREHPEMYGSELEDDEDDIEEELRERQSVRTLESSSQETGLVSGQARSSQNTAETEPEGPNLIKDGLTRTGKPTLAEDGLGVLAHKDLQSAPAPNNKTA